MFNFVYLVPKVLSLPSFSIFLREEERGLWKRVLGKFAKAYAMTSEGNSAMHP